MMFPSTAIIRRDLLCAARQKRSFLWMVVLVSITSFFVVGFWPSEAMYYTRSTRISENIVLPSVMTWMFAVMLLVTPYAATSIVLERQRETLDLVRTTRMRPLGFVFAQLISVISLQMVLLLSTLPVVASVYFLVGLELKNLIAGVAMVFMAMLSCAVMGLYASSKSQNVLVSLVRAYMYAFVAMGGLVLVGGLILEELRIYRLSRGFEDVLTVASPAFAGIAASVGQVKFELVAVSGVIQGVFVVVGMVLVHLNVRKPDTPGNWLWETLLSDVFRKLRHSPSARPVRARAYRHIEDFSNPIFAKDTRFVGKTQRGLMHVLNLLLFAIATCIGIPSAIMAWAASPQDLQHLVDVAATWVIFMWFALGILAPLTTATAIANENELGNLDMLRVTRLRGVQVVYGKFLAGCRMLLPAFIVLTVWTMLLGRLDGHPAPGTLTTGYFSACLTGLLGVSMGILASSFAKTSTRAVIWAYTLTACLVILVFVAGIISYEVLSELRMAPPRNHFLTKAIVEIVMFPSPPLAYIQNWEEHRWNPSFYSPYWLCHVAFSIVLNCLIVVAACLKMTARWRANAD